MVGSAYPLWPLARQPKAWTALGSFGAPRDNGTRLHQGIDLYAPQGTAVLAAESGVVTAVQGWSGPGTKGLLVYSPNTDITILYGAVAPGSYPNIGTEVKQGEKIATIGVYPAGSTMLHLEIWPGKLTPPRPRWNPGEDPPSYDPAEYLTRAMDRWTPVPGMVPGSPETKPQVGKKNAAGLAGLALVAGLAYGLLR